MRRHAFLIKLLGGNWLTFGLTCLTLGSFLLGGLDWAGQIGQVLSGAAAALWQTLYHPLIAVVLLAWGAICVLLGWSLIRVVNWAQRLAQALHLLLAVYLFVAVIVGFTVAPQATAFFVLGTLLLTGNLGLAYGLRGRLASEVFSHVPLRTAPVVSRRCEFCGSSLNLQTGHCPECEPAIKSESGTSSGERPKPALTARFVSLADDTVYALSSQRPTLVGRELSRNDVNLSNPTVSRQHARVEYDIQNSRYVLIAMQDTNGTFVNDKLVRHRPLHDGDEVRFGRAKFRFQVVSVMDHIRG